ncbi:MAG: HAD hydrolase-like protein [archaeon]
MDPTDVKLIMFDLDNTLRPSMTLGVKGAKPWAFAKAVVDFHPKFEGKEDEIENIYLQTTGLNRIVQLRETEKLLSADFEISKNLEREWSNTFSSYIDEKSIPLYKDVNETISILKKRGYLLTVGSSVPQENLEEVLEIYPNLKSNLDLTLGNQKWNKREGETANFVKGVPYISFACGKFNLKPQQIAYEGDAVEDIRSGNEAGVYTIAKVNKDMPEIKVKLEAENPDLIIYNNSELLPIFTGPQV